MRRLRSVTTGLALVTVAACFCAPAQAATIPVTTQFDLGNSSDGQCSLREAIGAQAFDVPSGSAAGECPAGDPGDDTIALPAGLYPLGSVLNFIGPATIAGAGSTQTIISGISDRVFYVNYNGSDQPDLTLDGLTITGGHAQNGSAGLDRFGN